MDNFVLTCCSTVDLDEAFFEKRHIPFVCFHFRMDGVDYPDDLGHSISFKNFYDRIRNGATPTTSQVNSSEFIEFWEPFVKEGKNILHISLSSGISGVVNSAILAQKYLMEKYPGSVVKVVDSLGASSGYGMLVEYVADMKDEGKTLEECYEWAEEHKLNIHHWFFSTNLTSYRRGGRISSASFFLGQLLKICPLLNMDYLGRLIPRKKIRTKDKTIIETVNMMIEHAEDGTNYNGKCFICHSDCLDDAIKVKDLVESKFPNLKGKVRIYSVGTTIGSHTGPGTVALFFKGDKRED